MGFPQNKMPFACETIHIHDYFFPNFTPYYSLLFPWVSDSSCQKKKKSNVEANKRNKVEKREINEEKQSISHPPAFVAQQLCKLQIIFQSFLVHFLPLASSLARNTLIFPISLLGSCKMSKRLIVTCWMIGHAALGARSLPPVMGFPTASNPASSCSEANAQMSPNWFLQVPCPGELPS